MSFDRLAPWYRAMEALLAGSLMQRCRLQFLNRAGQSREALLVGEGPGRFLECLLKANPAVSVTCVDRSARMIEVARRRLSPGQANRVRFEHADVRHWDPPHHRFDLIVTHFFLDCFPPEQLALLVPRVSLAAAHEARWLLADFCEPSTGWRRWRGRWVLALMYRFFRVATDLEAIRLTPPGQYLQAAGFRLVDRRLANFGLLHSDLWRRGPA